MKGNNKQTKYRGKFYKAIVFWYACYLEGLKDISRRENLEIKKIFNSRALNTPFEEVNYEREKKLSN
jgi:hypothetical protein